MDSGLHEIDHYLDDFLFAGADKTSNCSKLMNTFTEVCSQSGVPIADDKTEGPSTRITDLGLLIDTENMLIQIHDEKVQELLYFFKRSK